MHIKRLAAPRTWKIKRKELGRFVVSINPGKKKEFAIPLLIVVRDLLGLVENAREGKYVIRKGFIKVDGVPRKDYKFPVGLLDVVEIERINKVYRVVFNKNRKLVLIEIPEKEKDLKVVKIIGKTINKKAKMQLNLFDSRNILVNDHKKYKVNDSLLIKVPSQEIVEHYKLEEGALAYLIGGKHVGTVARIVEIKEKDIKLTKDNKEFWTKVKNIIVIGKNKPSITVVGNE